jgi:hypothetical protein
MNYFSFEGQNNTLSGIFEESNEIIEQDNEISENQGKTDAFRKCYTCCLFLPWQCLIHILFTAAAAFQFPLTAIHFNFITEESK